MTLLKSCHHKFQKFIILSPYCLLIRFDFVVVNVKFIEVACSIYKYCSPNICTHDECLSPVASFFRIEPGYYYRPTLRTGRLDQICEKTERKNVARHQLRPNEERTRPHRVCIGNQPIHVEIENRTTSINHPEIQQYFSFG
jgi:hypothetical protein